MSQGLTGLGLHAKVALLGMSSALITAIARVALAAWHRGEYHQQA